VVPVKVTTVNIHVNRKARLLDRNMRKYAEREAGQLKKGFFCACIIVVVVAVVVVVIGAVILVVIVVEVVAGACGYGEEPSGSKNAGNFLTSCRTS